MKPLCLAISLPLPGVAGLPQKEYTKWADRIRVIPRETIDKRTNVF